MSARSKYTIEARTLGTRAFHGEIRQDTAVIQRRLKLRVKRVLQHDRSRQCCGHVEGQAVHARDSFCGIGRIGCSRGEVPTLRTPRFFVGVGLGKGDDL